MTNDEIRAWGLVRPVATSTDDWDPNIDNFGASNHPVSYNTTVKRFSESLMSNVK